MFFANTKQMMFTLAKHMVMYSFLKSLQISHWSNWLWKLGIIIIISVVVHIVNSIVIIGIIKFISGWLFEGFILLYQVLHISSWEDYSWHMPWTSTLY